MKSNNLKRCNFYDTGRQTHHTHIGGKTEKQKKTKKQTDRKKERQQDSKIAKQKSKKTECLLWSTLNIVARVEA
jgi:hypothetical protein